MLDQTLAAQFEQIAQRVRPDSSFAKDLRDSVRRASDLAHRFERERDAVERDNNLSEAGRRAAVLALVRDRFGPELARGLDRKARRAVDQAASRRKALGAPHFAKDDLAAGLERREVRDFVRSQPDVKRAGVAMEMAKDRKLGEAILSGPSYVLTGLSPAEFAAVHRIFLSTHFGDDLAQIDADLADFATLTTAVTIARQKLYAASGISETEFNQFWAEQQTEADKS